MNNETIILDDEGSVMSIVLVKDEEEKPHEPDYGDY